MMLQTYIKIYSIKKLKLIVVSIYNDNPNNDLDHEMCFQTERNLYPNIKKEFIYKRNFSEGLSIASLIEERASYVMVSFDFTHSSLVCARA